MPSSERRRSSASSIHAPWCEEAGKKRAAPRAVAARQVQLDRLPLLKKPLEQLGKFIDVPVEYWEGRMSATEQSALYKFILRDHSAITT